MHSSSSSTKSPSGSRLAHRSSLKRSPWHGSMRHSLHLWRHRPRKPLSRWGKRRTVRVKLGASWSHWDSRGSSRSMSSRKRLRNRKISLKNSIYSLLNVMMSCGKKRKIYLAYKINWWRWKINFSPISRNLHRLSLSNSRISRVSSGHTSKN